MQVVGTFQSSHQAPVPAIFSLLNSSAYQSVFVSKGQNIPQRYAFSHKTITQQLQAGVCSTAFSKQPCMDQWYSALTNFALRRCARL